MRRLNEMFALIDESHTLYETDGAGGTNNNRHGCDAEEQLLVVALAAYVSTLAILGENGV